MEIEVDRGRQVNRYAIKRIQKDRQTHTHNQIDGYGVSKKQINKQMDTQANKCIDRQNDIKTGELKDRQTDRKGSQTERIDNNKCETKHMADKQ